MKNILLVIYQLMVNQRQAGSFGMDGDDEMYDDTTNSGIGSVRFELDPEAMQDGPPSKPTSRRVNDTTGGKGTMTTSGGEVTWSENSNT